MMRLKVGTRVRLLYQFGGSGVIATPRRNRGESVPTPEWYIVREDDGGRTCHHRDMLAITNDQAGAA